MTNKYTTIFFILTIITNALLYLYASFEIGADTVGGDQWRWLQSVFELEMGKITFFEYIIQEFALLSHSHIITLLTFYFDHQLNNQSLVFDRLSGTLFSILSCIVFASFAKSKRDCIVILSICFSMFLNMTMLNLFSWSLLQIQVYTTTITLISLYIFVNTGYNVWVALILSSILLILGGPASIGFSLFAPYASLYLKFRKISIYISILWTIALVIVFYLSSSDNTHTGTSYSEFVIYAFSNPWKFTIGILNLFSNPIYYFRGNNYVLSFTFMVSTIATVIFLAKKTSGKDYDKLSIFTLLFLATMSVWILGVAKARMVALGPEYLLAPRYKTYLFMVTACLLVFWYMQLRDRVPKLLTLTIIVVTCCSIFQSSVSTRLFVYYKNTHAVRKAAILNFNKDQDLRAAPISCRAPDCKFVLNNMKKNKIGPFSGN